MTPRICTLDFETDPFLYDRVPKAFCMGFYDGQNFSSIWDSEHCITRTLEFLEKQPPSLILAHNGGKFDFHLGLVEHFKGKLRIINGRIVSAILGKHELRDSFSILPFALADYNKDDIDYWKLEREHREKNRTEIISYLRTDCVSLHEICTAFYREFTDKLTVGSAAMKRLKTQHHFERVNIRFDQAIRDKYYYGGRCEVLSEPGIYHKTVKIYDVNSMYPDAMASFDHPVSNHLIESKHIEPETVFIEVKGKNFGALPVRAQDGSLDFTCPEGIFHTTIWEYRAAVECRKFAPQRIIRTYGFSLRSNFREFVYTCYETRLKAKANGDKIKELLYKFVMNSGYGKFAQNPENYYDWIILHNGDRPPADPCPHCYGFKTCPLNCFRCNRLRKNRKKITCLMCDGSGFKWMRFEGIGNYEIWNARLAKHHFYNVATGASITGAARSNLLRGIAQSNEPLYCDTDSLICTELRQGNGVVLDNNKLGAWKLEATGDLAAIARKKLYAVFSYQNPGPNKRGVPAEKIIYQGQEMWCIKKAHKGAKLTGQDILNICGGERITYRNHAPAFALSGQARFIKRDIST